MKVISAIADKSGCGMVRIKQPADTIMAMDDSFTIVPLERHHFSATQDGRVTSVDESFLDADVLVLQRPMVPVHLALMKVAKQAGIAAVVEVDDDLHNMSKHHPLRKGLKPVHYACLKACTETADLVTVSTPTLAQRYAQHGRFAVVKNYVPRAYTEICSIRFNEHPVVGWAGSLASHPTDLKSTQGGVGRAIDNSQAIFRVIGHPDRVAQDLGITKPIDTAPWCAFEDYPHELSKFDVGICPLDNIPFNRSKSHLKPLEMASVGVPVVMSHVGEYRELPFGIFAASPSAWEVAIKRLIKDSSHRHHVAQQGRDTVKELYTLEAHAHEWVEAWEKAIDNAKDA